MQHIDVRLFCFSTVSGLLQKSTSQHLAALAKLFILITSVGVIAGTIAAISGYIAWLDLLYYVSYVKLVISFTKLVPQVGVQEEHASFGDEPQLGAESAAVGLDELPAQEYGRMVNREHSLG